MDYSEAASPRLRWLRAMVGGFLAELALIVVAGAIYGTTADATATMNVVVPPASFLVFIPAGYWSARPVPGIAVMQGALAGLIAVALYIGLGFVASLFVKGASVTDGFTPAYLVAHGLKIAGGGLGGWLLARKAATPAG
jgi:hypothetical protein